MMAKGQFSRGLWAILLLIVVSSSRAPAEGKNGGSSGKPKAKTSLEAQETSARNEWYPDLIENYPFASVRVRNSKRDSMVIREKDVKIDFSLVGRLKNREGKNIRFNLFEDAIFEGQVWKRVHRSSTSFSMIGDLLGKENGTFIITGNNDVLFAVIIPDGKRSFRVVCSGQAIYQVQEIDVTKYSGCGVCSTDVDLSASETHVPNNSYESSLPKNDGEATLDVLVVYTQAAKNGAGGTSQISNLIDTAEVETDYAFNSSWIDASLRIVHQQEIDYTETGQSGDDLYNLQRDPDVQELRDMYGADLVCLVVETMEPNIGGRANLLRSDSANPAETKAFSVVLRELLAGGGYLFAHEIGHTLGCHHAIGDLDAGNGSECQHGDGYDYYSHGWRWTGTDGLLYKSIMAYYDKQTRTYPTQYFSSPDRYHEGRATGREDSEDNARTVNYTAPIVASYRTGAVAPACEDFGEDDDVYEDDPDDYDGEFFVEHSTIGYDLTDYPGQWLSSIQGCGVSLDWDWYRMFVLGDELLVTIDCQFAHSEGDIDLRLYDQDGVVVGSSNTITDNEFIHEVLPSEGWYFVRVGYVNGFNGNTYNMKWDTQSPEPVSVSGNVRTVEGIGIPGVTMAGWPGSDPVTDDEGFYIWTVPHNWSGMIHPSKEGYDFTPDERLYANVMSPLIEQNYVGTYLFTSDFTGDGQVNLKDYGKFAGKWMFTDCCEPDWCGLADVDMSGQVDFEDFQSLIGEHWLEGVIQLDNGLSARWNFDEGTGAIANDFSGNNNFGMINGTTWTTGISGQALDFDGGNDYVSGTPFAVGNQGSIFAWIKPLTATSNMIFQVVSRENSDDFLWFNFIEVNGSQVLEFYTKSHGSLPSQRQLRYTNAAANLNLTDGNWHLVGMTHDGSSYKFYVDDIELNNLLLAFGSGDDWWFDDLDCANLDEWNIGKNNRGGNDNSYFEGSIDEVRIYNRPLNHNEIDGLYYRYLNDYIGYWQFDEGTGEVLNDHSGSGFDGLVGGATWTDGITGSALSFNGIYDYVRILGWKGITGSNSRSCSAWIRPNSSTIPGIIFFWGTNEGNGQRWAVMITEQGHLKASVVGGHVTGSTNLIDGQWHHISIVLADDGDPDAEEIILYIDGSVEEVSSDPQTINTAVGEDVYLGCLTTTNIQDMHYNGLIDEVRIYDRAISHSEIRLLCQRP